MSGGQVELNELDDAVAGDGDGAPKKGGSAIKSILGSVGIAVLLGGVVAGIVFVSPFGGSTQCEAVATVADTHEKKTKSFDDIVYVNLEPLIISLGPNANAEYLKITVSLETTKDHAKTAEHLQPHFRDVLNMYLRAVDEKDLVEPFAMTRLRAQMLRRMQTVASSDIVSDILITDFVLN